MKSGRAATRSTAGTRAGPALVAEAIEVRRGGTAVVAGFTLTHEPGGVVWLTGPNGAGKSSLMRVLAGAEPPAAGRVARLPIGDAPPRVGYYHPAMSLPPEAFARAFIRLAEAVGSGAMPLWPDRPLARKRCGELSTGEGKRLLLGAILTREPEFLFLDEPYEHLSEAGRAALTSVLERLAERSVVVVSTNQELPGGIRGRVIRLDVREPEVGP